MSDASRVDGASVAIRRAALPAAALAAVTALFLKTLGHPSLWLDEAWEANYYVGIAASPWYNRPVLYMGAERWMARLFGPTEFVLRLLPCLAGLAAIAMTWMLARRTLGRSCAWLAAGLLAIAPTFLYEAHQLKHYTFDALFTVLLLLAYLRYRDDPSTRRLGLFALTALVSFGGSFTSIFVLAAIGVVHAASWLRGGSARRAFASYAGVNLLLVVAFGGIYAAFHASAQSDTLLKEYFADAWAPVAAPLSIPGWIARQTRVLAEIAGASSFAAFALLLLAGAWRERAAAGPAAASAPDAARAASGRELPILTATLSVCLSILIATSAVHLYPYGSARLTLFLAPLVCILAAAGMLETLGVTRERPDDDVALPGGASSRGVRLRTIAVAGLLYVLMYPAIEGARPYLAHGWGTDGLSRTIAALAREQHPGEAIFVPERAMASFPYYWWRAGRSPGAGDPDVIDGERHRLHPRDHAAQIGRIADAHPLVWVLWYDQSREERETMRGMFLERYESVRSVGERESESVELFRGREETR